VSDEAVAVVRGCFALADQGGARAMLDVLDPDVVWDVSRNSPEPKVWRGRDAFVNGWREWMQDWSRFEVRLDEVVDAGDVVVALIRQSGRGRASGVEVEQELASVFTVVDGRITRIATYADRGEALRDAGLAG
jgi:ketosteroid isomerase-like protein